MLHPPGPQGLYDPAEHDACGVAFVVDMHGRPSHEIVSKGIGALCNLEHRGASGRRGQHRRRRRHPHPGPRPLPARGRRLRPARRPGAYATGIAFLPGRRPSAADAADEPSRRSRAARACACSGWRDVPIDASMLGATARAVDARRSARCSSPARRPARAASTSSAGPSSSASASSTRSAPAASAASYFPSLSCRTLVYKGMLTTPQLGRVLPRPRATSGSSRALALVHSPLLHQHVPVVAAGPPVPLHRPQRRDQHGAGQPQLDAGPRGAARQRPARRGDLERIFPICTPGRQRLGQLRRGARAARTSAAARCPTPC